MDVVGLLAFLDACFAEDESAAWNAGPHEWQAEGKHLYRPNGDLLGEMVSPWYAGHVARHSPAQALAECAVRRRRVKALTAGAPPDAIPLLWSLLALEAVPFSDRPGYRSEWAP